jgi:hypothetical protein
VSKMSVLSALCQSYVAVKPTDHRCGECGYEIDRDIASAQVVRQRGLAAVGHTVQMLGEGLSTGSLMTQESSPLGRRVSTIRVAWSWSQSFEVGASATLHQGRLRRRHPRSKRYHRQKLRLASAHQRGCQSVSKILALAP